MPRMDIVLSPARSGVFAIILDTHIEKIYYHFATQKQAMAAVAKVEKIKTTEETKLALKKLCGGDYFSPSEEASRSR